MGFKEEQFVNCVDVNLFCSLCHEVFEDPLSCKDGHTFCNVCILKCLKKNQECPIDNRYLSKYDLVPQYTVKGIIENLKVYCQPHSQDNLIQVEDSGLSCEWVGKLQNLPQHRKTCPFQMVKCSHEKCDQKVQRKKIEFHEKICDFRKTKCEKCGTIVFQKAKLKHITDECLQALTVCPNRCTDTKQQLLVEIKRVDVDNHIKTICPKTILDCPFKDQGCSVRVERQHVDKHVQDNMAAHMVLLAKQCSSLTVQNLSLVEQNTSLHEEFSILAEECSTLSLRCFQLKEKNCHLQGELTQAKETCSYTWTIDDFPSICSKHGNGSVLTSPIFWLVGHRLSFLIYPNGINEEAEGWVSLYLNVSEEYPKVHKVFSKLTNIHNSTVIKFRLSVKGIKEGTDHRSNEVSHAFKEPGSWGWPRFMRTSDTLSETYCSSTNGSLTIQCTIQPDKPQ